jgi:hypothetical protein
MRSDISEALLRFINAQNGTAFALGERYPTGEQGAFAISEASGNSVRPFVLKWEEGSALPDHLRQAVAVTGLLRDVGYPAPRYRLIGMVPSLGVVYSIQEALPGTPLGGRLDRPLLDRLLALNALQAGQATTPTDTWPRPVAEPVLHGGDGYCLLDPLRSYSRRTATLLGVLQHLAAVEGDERSPRDDVVHFDFQGANILVAGDEISGVVDWEGCRAGDRAFDLATLFFYAGAAKGADTEQLERLWRLLVEQSGPRLVGVYLAHLVLRQVDWSIRFYDDAEVERWLGRADEVLRQLSDTRDEDATS